MTASAAPAPRTQGRRPHLGFAALVGVGLVAVASAIVFALDIAPRPESSAAVNAASGPGAAAPHHVAGPEPGAPIADQATRRTLAREVRAARDAVAGITTIEDALERGYLPATVDLAWSGMHFVDPQAVDKPFEPARPTHLIFDRDGPGGRLIGLMYYVKSKGQPPDGFAGSNDQWHNHTTACMAGDLMVALGDVTSSTCETLGGVISVLPKKFTNSWMVHLWAVPGQRNPWGLFASASPALA